MRNMTKPTMTRTLRAFKHAERTFSKGLKFEHYQPQVLHGKKLPQALKISPLTQRMEDPFLGKKWQAL